MYLGNQMTNFEGFYANSYVILAYSGQDEPEQGLPELEVWIPEKQVPEIEKKWPKHWPTTDPSWIEKVIDDFGKGDNGPKGPPN